MPGEEQVVLIVEDYRDQADLYTEWLQSDYDVRTAYTGTQALERLDENVDVVLLDRRLPRISGDELLEEIKHRGYSCHVAMVTAVEPDFDIVEMGFDSYLVKPVTAGELREEVRRLMALHDYHDTVQEQFALSSKVGALRASKTQGDLQASPEYHQLNTKLDQLQSRAHHQLSRLFEQSDDEWVFNHIDDGRASMARMDSEGAD